MARTRHREQDHGAGSGHFRTTHIEPAAGDVPRVVLVGVHGFGSDHLRTMLELARNGRVRIAGLADLRPPSSATRAALAALPGPACAITTDAGTLLDAVRPDVTIVSTPIATHLPLARRALEAGSHLLLEKPPVATLAQFDELAAATAASGRACQVGFQALGSRPLTHAARLVRGGALGRIRGVGVHGAWVRDRAYFDRAPWAGRMVLDGVPVTDGALTNAFAHAIAAALRVLGDPVAGVPRIELERFRLMAAEGDDTACARITVDGIPIVVAVTLCADTSREPRLVVHGDGGRLELDYTRDALAGHTRDGAVVTAAPVRTGLLENLIEHLAHPAVPLVAPLSSCRTFMQVLDAVRCDGPATALPAHLTLDRGDRLVAAGIDDVVTRCAEELRLFSELPTPWPAGTAT